MRTALAIAFIFAGTAAADPAPAGTGDVESFPGRFFLEHSQGFTFLSGGYADSRSFYSAIWDEGSSFSVAFGFEPCPAIKTGVSASYCGYDDSGLGLDRLDTGSVAIIASLQAPLALDADLWFKGHRRDFPGGFVISAGLGIGLHLVDTTWDAIGRIIDRTITYVIGVRVEFEYRSGPLGFFVSGGISLCGPPRAAEGYDFNPQQMLVFPAAVGLRIYI